MLLLKPKSELSYSSFTGTFSVSENSKPTYVFAPPVATRFKKLRPRLHRGHERPHFRDAKRCSWNRTGGDYGRTEYAYYKMATQAGIVMSPSRLLEENDRAHFMTRRFDRDVIAGMTAKYHSQTLCAMAHLDYKQRGTHAYSQLFMTISELKLGDEALQQAFLRMTFNVMTRNYDDHTKNFSFLRKQDQGWELAPAYDVTHAHNPRGEWTYQHLMSVNGKFDGIARADLFAEADRFSVPKAEELIVDVRSAIENWPDHAQSAGLHEDKAQELHRDFLLL